MGEFFLAGRLGQVALHGTVHLLGGIMGHLLDIPMAIQAHDSLVRALHEEILIDIEEPESAVLIDTAKTPEFMAQHAVQLILRLSRGGPDQTNKPQEYEK